MIAGMSSPTPPGAVIRTNTANITPLIYLLTVVMSLRNKAATYLETTNLLGCNLTKRFRF